MLLKIGNILAALALVFGIALIGLAVYLTFFNAPPPPRPPLPRISKPASQNIPPNLAAPQAAPAAAQLPAPQ